MDTNKITKNGCGNDKKDIKLNYKQNRNETINENK